MQGTPKTSVEGSIVDPELQGNPITEFMERDDGTMNGRRLQGTPKTSVEGSTVNPESLEMKKLVSRSSDSDAPPWLNRGANVEPERTQRVTRSKTREQTELNFGEGKCEVVKDIGGINHATCCAMMAMIEKKTLSKKRENKPNFYYVNLRFCLVYMHK
jgi:hypothetical protein